DHAVVLREPLDGGAGSVGARTAGAGQRPVRRAQRPVHPEQRRSLLRNVRRVQRDDADHRAQPVARARARPQRPPVLPRALRLAGDREEVPRHVRPSVGGAAARADRAAAGMVRETPPRSTARRRRARRAADGTGAPARRETDGVIRIHQVLATLGYGDAIGHEVLGIQRVLRSAGYGSEIFVETADYRLEELTRDYRELVDYSHPDNLLIHHFSLGSKASRTAFAVPDRMALIYHNITPPEYFVGVHRTLARQCFRGRRELGAYANRCDLALGDSEFNRQDLESLGFPRTAVLPVVP